MKRNIIIGILLLIIVIAILPFIYNHFQCVDRYRTVIVNPLTTIGETLQQYYIKHKKFPMNLECLLHERPRLLTVTICDSSNDSIYQNYKSPFLYYAKLNYPYEQYPQNTIIVASPRCRKKRYVLLLETVLTPELNRNKLPIITIKTMEEDDFQKQAKIQGWIIPEQKFDPEKVEKQRIEKLKQKQKEWKQNRENISNRTTDV